MATMQERVLTLIEKKEKDVRKTRKDLAKLRARIEEEQNKAEADRTPGLVKGWETERDQLTAELNQLHIELQNFQKQYALLTTSASDVLSLPGVEPPPAKRARTGPSSAATTAPSAGAIATPFSGSYHAGEYGVPTSLPTAVWAMPDVTELDPRADTYIESLVELLGWHEHQHLLHYAWQLRKKLAESALSLDDLCQPELRHVLWPSATEADQVRFPKSTSSMDGLWSVPMFGRAQLASIYERMQGSHRLFLFGLAGVGKSHLLAMLALLCLGQQLANSATGQPASAVCFIPNLRNCVTDRDGVWKALVEALVLNPCALVKLARLRNDNSALPVDTYFSALTNFVQGNNVVLIADQHNAVDKDPSTGQRTALCEQVANFIANVGIKGPSQLVFAASANQQSIAVLTTKQDQTSKMVIEPFSLAEAQTWAAQERAAAAEFITGESAWALARSVTGLVPLELGKLLAELSRQLPSAQPGAMDGESRAKAWEQGVEAYSTAQGSEVHEDLASFCADVPGRCAAILDACSLQPIPRRATRALVDWRYFSVTDMTTLTPAPASELVRREATLLALGSIQEQAAQQVRDQIVALLRSPHLAPPSVGYLVEDAVMSALGREGIPVTLLNSMGLDPPPTVEASRVKLEVRRFAKPPGPQSLGPSLLIPFAYNYEHVDGVIVYQTSAGKQAIIGIQVTTRTVQKHQGSLAFLDAHWKKFLQAGASVQGAEASTALLWITPEAEVPRADLPQLEKYPHQWHQPLECYADALGKECLTRLKGRL